MLRTVKPQIVSVATGGYEYGSDHALPTLQALEAGCHVLCEKPISNELEPAKAMVAKAKEKRLCLGCDFNHRFTPVARQAKKWQDEGLIGDLLFCNMALWIGKFQPLDSRYYHLKALNPHSIDMMRYYCGEIRRVQLFAMTAPGRNIWSTASFNMQFANGAVGHLTSSYDIERGHPMERCEVAGTKGRMLVEDMWREATLFPAGNLEKRVFTNPVFGGYTGFDDTFRERLRCFVRQVAAGAKPEEIDGSGEDALKGLRVILAAIRSLDTGQVVDVDSL
jgi:predicted dehydrogenase